MWQRLCVILILIAAAALAQSPSVRVEVRSDAGPVQNAEVTASGHSARTGQD
jgi:hypothetical protein